MTHSALESQYNAAGSLPSKKAPGSAPVKLSGRLFEPDRVVVSDSPHHKDGRECVNDESRVEVLQIAGADDDRRAKKRCHRCRKCPCTQLHHTTRNLARHFCFKLPALRQKDIGIEFPQRSRDGCEQNESRPDDTEPIAKKTEQKWREKTTQPAHCADESGYDTRTIRKILRHQLKDTAISNAQQYRATERSYGERNNRCRRHQQREWDYTREHTPQHARAADAIGKPSAGRPHRRSQHHESCCPKARVTKRQTKLITKQQRQVHG